MADSFFDLDHYNSLAGRWEKESSKKEAERDRQELHDLRCALIKYLNRFFVVVKSRNPEILELEYDETGQSIVDFTRRHVRQHWSLYSKKFMQNQWFGCGSKREVDRLVFEVDPVKVSPREFNMFLGLRIERDFDVAGTKLDEDCIAPILELLRDVWAEGNTYVYDYILNWMAYPLKVKRKTGVCLVVISDQGYGKGTIAHDLLGVHIYGEVLNDRQSGSYAQITDIEHIVGKFNTASCMRLLINADECSSFGGAYKQNNKLKSLITSTTRLMEAKGLDPVNISDFANFLMTTNNDEPGVAHSIDNKHFTQPLTRRGLVTRDRDGDHRFLTLPPPQAVLKLLKEQGLFFV
ncbi:hypothetical protein WJX73_006762 [Symbiochloris irregularis]|uniref:NrS-1 polymerase-like helicase domain-containing protein n=1 Tax=Symbiochloris irregularis TaxID=706552 RepID=A0AAW1NTX5_9CHLO